jgi:membrane protease YdiL (CAAX protease family)
MEVVMSLARRLAVISSAVWLIIGIAFTFLVLDSGLEGLASSSGERTRSVLAGIILPGYLISFALIWWTYKGRRAGEIDERDKKIESRATGIVGIVVLLTVFLVSIGLYDTYLDRGAVPVGWLYILAYGTIVWVSFLHPVLRLIIDFSGTIDG